MKAWIDFLKRQEIKLGPAITEQWLRPLKIVHFDSGNLYLEANDSFQILWFEEHVRPLLKSQLLTESFRPIKVHLTLADSPITLPAKHQIKPPPPLSFTLDKLNPLMTFKNFVPGKTHAHIYRFFCELTGYDSTTQKFLPASTSLASFNPIYLWGPSGSGKTHLLMALTQAFRDQGFNALYAKSETFTEHVVSAIRSSEMQIFRKHYRQVDILLIDDVHQLSRKFATQEEFFHTFNTLHASGRQVILSSKCTPSQLEEIEPRLISRFEWGINLHFEKLQMQDFKDILARRCTHLNFPLAEEVSTFLLESFSSSHTLYQALETLILRCHLEGDLRHKRNSRLLDLATAKHLLKEVLEQEQQVKLSPEKINTTVCSFFGIRLEDLLGKAQTQECSLPRQIAMYLYRKELQLPFQKIGYLFKRDHSTVMTSIKQIEKKLETPDRDILFAMSEIKRHLDSRPT